MSTIADSYTLSVIVEYSLLVFVLLSTSCLLLWDNYYCLLFLVSDRISIVSFQLVFRVAKFAKCIFRFIYFIFCKFVSVSITIFNCSFFLFLSLTMLSNYNVKPYFQCSLSFSLSSNPFLGKIYFLSFRR